MLFLRSRLIDLWDRMRSSYWFVPSIMFAGAVAAALLMVSLDLHLSRTDATGRGLWFPKFGADASRSILSTIASGMLTVTGVVFSLTIVALQLASSQFGPRLLRTFMTSRGTQVVLGTFLSSFIFCLLVIGSVRSDLGFVPQLSTAAGIMLGVLNIAVLIYFIHHLATSIRIESLLATVSGELREVIDKLFPSQMGEEPPQRAKVDPSVSRASFDAIPPAGHVCAAGAGYVRHIDSDMLMSAAQEHDLVMRIEQQPGAFVVEGTPLLSVWIEEEIPDDLEGRLRASFVLGQNRTTMQDVNFAISQLVEVALRALSPGINDPFTAIECTNRLGEALCTVARRPRPSSDRYDTEERLRIIVEPMHLKAMTHTAFDPIARAGGSNGDVATRMLETILIVATCCRHRDDRRFLLQFARELEEQVQGQLPLERDRRAVAERFQTALETMRRGCPSESLLDESPLQAPQEGTVAAGEGA
ncbi:MAG: DUF2254 domain-containing protein [Defluviicoccus sp.]|nr:MAG: DUF2254 domain-containing protein [Defluviicoccus sp.]